MSDPPQTPADDEEDDTPPTTPLMVQEQLTRIGLVVALAHMADWSEPLCTEAFNWAVDVEIALLDGQDVTIAPRPAALTTALEQFNPDFEWQAGPFNAASETLAKG